MATVRLRYFIPSRGSGDNDGRMADVTFTYDDTAPNSDGTFTATGATGTYEVIGDTGNIVRTDTIDELAPPNSYNGNDNHISIGSQPYVNFNGINYIISNFADSNNQSGYVNFYYDAGSSSPGYVESGRNGTHATAVLETVCFVTGTHIQTVRGDTAVENLMVGDIAVTASGRLRPITWIGHRDLDGNGRHLPHDQQPVRIRQGAFGPGLPARDLCLSPGHPVLVGADADEAGGVLVPIMCLINGTTIAREPRAHVTYWHVELDVHDILLAEGLAAESYLDWGDRAFFTEASDHALHNPDFMAPGLSGRCRPVALDGPLVEAERARLDTVFAAELTAHCAWGEADVFARL